jgi:hypothetical protein
MPVTKIRSRWVAGELEFFVEGTDDVLLKMSTEGLIAAMGVSGGPVNPTIKCIADGAISAGNLVYPSGYDATTGLLKMKKADADAADPAKVAWFVAPDAIGDGEEGAVVGEYLLTGQNTNSAAAVGAPVYLSTTAGGWSLTAPTGGGHAIQQVGVVTVKNATTGAVFLMPFYSKAVTVNTIA